MARNTSHFPRRIPTPPVVRLLQIGCQTGRIDSNRNVQVWSKHPCVARATVFAETVA